MMKKLILTVISILALNGFAVDIPEIPGFRLLDAAHKNNLTGNVLLSPLSMQQCFGMLVGGAGEVTGCELQEYLGLSNASVQTIQQVVNELKSSEHIQFDSCNSVIFDYRLPVEQAFINASARMCGAKVFKADFSRPGDCAAMLNNIVKEQSRGLVENLFQDGDFAGSPLMVLLNVLYFKGNWATPFEVYNTAKAPFAVPGEDAPQEVDMMCAEMSVPYCNDGIIHGITLAYSDRRFKMMFLMPVDPNVPLSVVTERLASCGLGGFIGNSTMERKTEVRLPKLQLSSDLDLRTLLAGNGMEIIFSASRSDLSGIVRGIPLYVDSARQVVKLNLNEAGTEVAAVTSVMVRACAVKPPEEINKFHADRPFVMVLFDSVSGAVVLSAVVNRVIM